MKKYYYLMGIFFGQFLYFILSFSLISFFSFHSADIIDTAKSVGPFAIGGVFALMLQSISKNYHRRVTAIIISMLAALAFSVCLIFISPTITILAALSLVVISAGLNWSSSYLFALAPAVHYGGKIGEEIQIFATLATLLGVSIAPILGANLNYQWIWILFSILLLIYIVFYWHLTNISISPLTFAEKDCKSQTAIIRSEPISKGHNRGEFLSYRLFPLSIIVTSWIATGFFQVYEVRLLVERFYLLPTQISLIFAGTIMANILSIRFISPSVSNLFISLSLSSLAIILSCLFYLYTKNLIAVILLIIFIGSVNGLFNVAYTKLILKNSSLAIRERTFLLARVLAQFSLSISAMLSLVLTLQELSTVMWYLFFFTMVLIASFLLKIRGVGPEFASRTLKYVLLFPACGLLYSSLIVAEGRELKVLVSNIPDKIDLSKIADSTSALMANQMYQKLYRFDENNFLIAEVAENSIWSNNLTELEITLKKNVKFSNGDNITAGDVYDSFIEVLRSQKESIKWALGDLAGFENAAKKDDFCNVGIKIVDQNKLKFKFVRPNPLFINFIASPSFYIYRKQNDAKMPLGSKGFEFESKSQDAWVLKSTSAAASKINKIIFSRNGSYVDHDIDTTALSRLDQSLLEGNSVCIGGHCRHRYPLLQMVVMVFNSQVEPFSNQKVRCQLVSSFQKIFSDNKTYNWMPVGLGIPFAWEIKKINSINGLNNLKGTFDSNITIQYANSAAQFSEALNRRVVDEFRRKGIKIVFQDDNIHQLIRNIQEKRFQIALFGYVPDYPSMDALLTPLLGTGQGYNFIRYSNKELDQVLDSARRIGLRKDQNLLYGKALDIVTDNCPIGLIGTQYGEFTVRSDLIIPKFSSLGLHNLNMSEIRIQGIRNE